MYKFKTRLKAKNALLKCVFSLFLFSCYLPLFSQTWEYSISKDFEFSIQDKWGESGLYEVKFVMYNQKNSIC
jgi:hypothetical protein